MKKRKRSQRQEYAGCGLKGQRPDFWVRNEYPKCNRPVGHAGPHREYTDAAEVLAEWSNEDVRAPKRIR